MIRSIASSLSFWLLLLILGGILGLLYQKLYPRIAQNEADFLRDAIATLMIDRPQFQADPFNIEPFDLTPKVHVLDLFRIRPEGEHLKPSYVLHLKTQGYMDGLHLLVHFEDQRILNIQIHTHQETPGIINRVQSEAFLSIIRGTTPELLERFWHDRYAHFIADGASGATLSATGVLRALKSILLAPLGQQLTQSLGHSNLQSDQHALDQAFNALETPQ